MAETEAEVKRQKLLSRYSISPAGDVLGGMISTSIDEQLNMDKLSCCCPSISDFLELMSRKTGYSTNKAIERAIKAYMVNYGDVSMRSIGSALLTVPVPIAIPAVPGVPQFPPLYIPVDNAYGLDINGTLSFTDNDLMNNLFSTFSLSRLLGISGSDEDAKENVGVAELFNDIVSWLSCNNIPGSPTSAITINGNSFNKEIITTTLGTVYFNAIDSEIDTIIKNTNDRLFKLNSDNIAYTNTKNKAMPHYFEFVWDIIATGLVEYMSINYINALNNGFGIMGLSLYTYAGTATYNVDGSETGAKVVFGSDYVQRVETIVEFKIPLPAPLTLPKEFQELKISENIKLPNARFTFKGKDANGQEKRTNIDINFPNIAFNFWEGLKGFEAQVLKVTTDLYANIVDMLTHIGYVIDSIEEVLLGVYNKIMEISERIINKMTGVLARINDKYVQMLNTILVRVQRQLQWNLLAMTTPAFAALNKSLDMVWYVKSQVDNALTAIATYTQKIKDSLKFLDIVKLVNTKIVQIKAVQKKMKDKALELIDFGVIIIQIGLDKLNSTLQVMVDGIVNKLSTSVAKLTESLNQKAISLTNSMIEKANNARSEVEIKTRARLKLKFGDVDLDTKVNNAMKQLDIMGVFEDITASVTAKANSIRSDVQTTLSNLTDKVTTSVTNKFKTVKFKNLPTKVLNIRKNFMELYLKCPISKTISTMYDTITTDMTITGIDTISDGIVEDIDTEVTTSITTEVDIVDKSVDTVVNELVEVTVDSIIKGADIVCGGSCCGCSELSQAMKTFESNMEFSL